MSLPTTLIVPNNLVAGTDALAADLNGNNSYITSALNTTNTAVNANTNEIVTARSGELSLDARIDGVSAVANAALPASYLDTDGTLVGNSNVKVPSQKAVKTYVDANSAADRAFAIQRANHTGTQPQSTIDNLTTDLAAVQAYAIQRANHTGTQAQSTIDNLVTDLAGKVGANNAALTGIPTAPTAVSGTNTTQIATTEFVNNAAFNAALPSQTGNAGKFVTTDGTNASWGAPALDVAYADRGTLRSLTTLTDSVIVDGIGLFRHVTGSMEPDDDETCFATATGRWLLQCPHSDFITAQLISAPYAPLIYTASAVNTIGTVATVSVVSQTIAVAGASTADIVVVTPPAVMDGRLSVYGYVSAHGVVTVSVANPSAATSTAVPAGSWSIAVISTNTY